jgi:hypothetical protein
VGKKLGESFPIFLVENAIYGSEWWDSSFAKSQQSKRNNLRAAYDTLVEAGDKALFYVEGDKLLAPNTGIKCLHTFRSSPILRNTIMTSSHKLTLLNPSRYILIVKSFIL